MQIDHKGKYLSVWVSEAQMEKVVRLAEIASVSKSDVIRALIDGRALPEKSFWKMCNKIASIGGLIKSKLDEGKRGEAYQLGCDIVKLAHEIRDGQCKDNNVDQV